MYKIYLVFGPESSGNHLVTNILIKGGIKRGTSTSDVINPKNMEREDFPIVFRRSFPHGGVWYKWEEMLKPLFQKKLIQKEDIFVIVLIRNWSCAIKSSIKRGHSKNYSESLFKLKKAYKNILEQIKDLDYMFFSFDETIINKEQQVKFLFEQCEIPIKEDKIKEICSKITEENSKYYGNEEIKLNRKTEVEKL